MLVMPAYRPSCRSKPAGLFAPAHRSPAAVRTLPNDLLRASGTDCPAEINPGKRHIATRTILRESPLILLITILLLLVVDIQYQVSLTVNPENGPDIPVGQEIFFIFRKKTDG